MDKFPEYLKTLPELIKEDIEDEYPADEDNKIPSGVELLSDVLEGVFDELNNISSDMSLWVEFEKSFKGEFKKKLNDILEEESEKLHKEKLDKLDEVLRDLHDEIFEKSGLLESLINEKTKNIIFVPTRELFLVPLHAAFSEVNGNRKYIQGHFEDIRYLPSIYFYKQLEECGDG